MSLKYAIKGLMARRQAVSRNATAYCLTKSEKYAPTIIPKNAALHFKKAMSVQLHVRGLSNLMMSPSWIPYSITETQGGKTIGREASSKLV